MCLRGSVFPLVRLKNGKRKVLFNLDYKITNVDDYNNIKGLISGINFSIRYKNDIYYKPGYQYLKKVMKNEGVEKLEDLIAVPCGHCEDCLKANARAWSIRILEEAKQYKNNYFITLTYDDEHLPLNGSLVKDEISKFNKKLKTYLNRLGMNSYFRFFGVGEYGSQTFRPHYHVIYFNLDLPDIRLWRKNELGQFIFRSDFLESCWSMGNIEIGSVSVQSACYVARYCDKKKKNLTREDLDLMKKFNLEPEFSCMSRRPGIGANYIVNLIDNVKNGVYKIQYKNNNFSIPKFYTKKFEELLSEEEFKTFKSYNDMISNDFTYRNIMLSNLIDIEQEKYYNESVVSKSKKKRGF